MVAPSLDHLPYSLDGFERSVTVEQRFPLSPVLKHRKEQAEAGIRAAKADTSRTILDVQFDALAAFFMLYERRQSAQILEQQLSLTREVVAAANARYAGATGTQQLVSNQLSIPSGYRLQWTGQYEFMAAMESRMKVVLPLTLILIVALLYLSMKGW